MESVGFPLPGTVHTVYSKVSSESHTKMMIPIQSILAFIG